MCGVNCGWKHSMRFHDLATAHDDKEITINQFCAELGKRIEAHHLATENDRMRHFGELFSICSTKDKFDEVALDNVLEEFYDFADDDKMLWLE